MFTIRFDMRVPPWAGPPGGHYRAAIDMCAWAETRGAVIAVLSEHHGTADRHLPAPLILASAIAARTTSLGILLAAVPITFWDPVRLAEEISVLDLISGGRVAYAFGIGHRPEEYAHFGVEMARRGRLAEELIDVTLRLINGETVNYRGRSVTVTPSCASPGGPTVMIAGGSKAAARRASRHNLGFISQTAAPGLKEFYESQCRLHGHEPGAMQFPVPGTATAVFVADDVDAAWDELGRYLLHDAVTAASYRHGDDSIASITRAATVSDLRQADSPYRILSADEAADVIRGGHPLALHPLCGGIPPDAAWRYLKNAAGAAERARSKSGVDL
ncbi:MAG: LLM class flavin-dependent oxidoreductase [Mycobacteriaceae bacterium]|nr:LLM class flavin-dependent oxidoreductase [Mycobacteriaceae bacterium]